MENQSTLKDTAKAYESHKNSCIECGIKLKDYRSLRCRPCFKMFFKDYSNFGYSQIGNKNGKWKGDEVKYNSLHSWLRRHKSKVKNCEFCGKKKKLDIAKISKDYTRNINYYKWLCKKCHNYLDGTIKNLKSSKSYSIKLVEV